MRFFLQGGGGIRAYWDEHQVTLGVEAAVFGLLEVGPGRGQVFNDYFHSSPAVWRDCAVAVGVARSREWGPPGEVWERGAPSGARERTGRKGGVKGSAGGGGRSSDAGRTRRQPIPRNYWTALLLERAAARLARRVAAAGPAEGLAGEG